MSTRILQQCLQKTRKFTENPRALAQRPLELFGIDVNSEWRSDWKWQRLLPHIQPLDGRTVLDVGCGNGYHLWRMYGAGAKTVVGIDPCALFFCQFRAIWHLAQRPDALHFLPLGLEELPSYANFDTVFSMGVLYHRKSPIEHLEQLKNQLTPGGELVLETLVIEGDAQHLLIPPQRYGKMNNIWFIPSSQMPTLWLEKIGFTHVRVVDEQNTHPEEQRRTSWMQNESLADFCIPMTQRARVKATLAQTRDPFGQQTLKKIYKTRPLKRFCPKWLFFYYALKSGTGE